MSKKYCVVAVEEEQHQQLKNAEKLTGIPISRIVKKAIGAYLETDIAGLIGFIQSKKQARK